jgi:PPM family protein phosphatase
MSSPKELSQAETREFPTHPTKHSESETFTPLSVDLGAATHQGLVRKNNEDHYLVVRFGRFLEALSTNLSEDLLQRDFNLTGYGMFVADGMGGHAAGELASSLALAKLVALVLDTPDWILELKRQRDVSLVLQRLTQRFIQIDKTLRERAEKDASLLGMGTTLTVAGILGNELVIGHVGDSRAYLLRDNNLMQLTTDHTLAQALVDAGIAAPDDPASRQTRHILTSALGSGDRPMEPQMRRVQLQVGDCFLLCTDGLTDMVDESVIESVLHEADSAQRGCKDLIDLALAGGGRDNITVVLARFGF